MIPGDETSLDETPKPAPPEPDDDRPGVPGFRTWRGVYACAFACFVVVVVLLTIFSRTFA